MTSRLTSVKSDGSTTAVTIDAPPHEVARTLREQMPGKHVILHDTNQIVLIPTDDMGTIYLEGSSN